MDDSAPERVALVLGIPVSVEEVRERSSSGVPWDYGEQKNPEKSACAEVFPAIYDEIGAAASALFATATQAQHTIYRGATLADLKEAFSSHDVVVVLAHWRGSWVVSRDLLTGWVSRFHGLVKWSGPRSAVLRTLRQYAVDESADRFAAALSEAIYQGDFRPCFPSGISHLQISQSLSAAISRDIVDEAFHPHLRPGNSLELFDGMHPSSRVVGAIPSDFRGTLDLSCCTSSVLATQIRFALGDAVTVISNDESIPPDYQMRVIEGSLWLARRLSSGNYARARRKVAVGLGDWRRRPYRCNYL